MYSGECQIWSKWPIILALWIGSIYGVYGQSTSGLTMADGLSQGMVIDVIQDSRGFLWIGTMDGLNRYNGYEIDVFNFIPDVEFSLSDHGISALFEDSRGLIWVGTFSGGVNVFDPNREKFFQIHRRGEMGLQFNHILSINEDSTGNMWIGGSSGLDVIFLPSNWDFSSFERADITDKVEIKHFLESHPVHDVTFHDNKVWIASGQRVFLSNSDNEFNFELFERDHQVGIENSKQGIMSVHIDRYSNIWLRRTHTLTSLTPDTVIHHSFGLRRAAGKIDKIVDDLGYFIIGGNNVTKYNPRKDGTLEKVEELVELPNHKQANKLYQDRSGLVWISTAGYGLKKYNFKKSRFGHLLKNKTVRFINEDDEGRIFVSGRPGLFVIESNSNKIISPKNIPEDLLASNNMLFDRDGVYWFLLKGDQNDKLVSWDPNINQRRVFTLSHNIHFLSFLTEDKYGDLWLFSEDEMFLLRFNKESEKNCVFNLREYFGVSGVVFFHTHFVHHGGNEFWLSSSHGLLKLEIEDGEITKTELFSFKPGDPNSIGSNYIFHFQFDLEDPDLIWVATRGGGLNKLNIASGRAERITTKDGLPNNVVYSVLPHNGNLWMSTNRGISKYNPENGEFTNYSPAEGLQDFEFNFASHRKLKDGRLAFGGVNGINIFEPGEIELNNTIPRVEITSVRVKNERINHANFDSPKKLSYEENTIFFSFASLDFNDPSKNVYKYKLDGVDKEWLKSGTNREVTYANLPPGSYTFRVMGTNNSGLWSEEEAIFAFVIHPPWWKTNLAYLIYLLITAGLVFSFVRFQRTRMKIQNQLRLEKLEKERLEKLDRIKTNFFDNITHELKSPLTLILEPLRQTIPKVKEKGIIKDLKTAERSSHQLLNLIDQLLELSRLESGELQLKPMPGAIIHDLEKTVSDFSTLAKKNRVDLRITSPNQKVMAEYDHQALKKIINNLVSNAVKFTPAGGTIEVRIRVNDKGSKHYWKVLVEVKDSGIGMDGNELERVFDRFFRAESVSQKEGTGIGLPIAKELTELMGGSLTVNSIKGKGTTFKLILFLKKAKAAPVGSPFKPGYPSEFTPTKGQTGVPQFSKNGNGTVNQHPENRKIILITEDNPEIREFISDIFFEKFEVLKAEDGAEGLEVARNRIPDLIISDWMMPNATGLEFCKEIKSDDLTNHIPFILLTAKSSANNKVEGLQAMADAYISKPFHSGELFALVDSLIANREVAQKKLQQETLQQYGFGEISKELDKLNSDPFIQNIDKILQENLKNESLKVEDIASELLISRMQLHRKLKGVTGQTSSEYIRNFRLRQGYFLLTNTGLNISEVAVEVGMPNRNYFSRTFKEKYGVSPSEVHRNTDSNSE